MPGVYFKPLASTNGRRFTTGPSELRTLDLYIIDEGSFLLAVVDDIFLAGFEELGDGTSSHEAAKFLNLKVE